ncbi:MAG: MarR family winged helix-turn-helix transcriptional regulator [Acutalibacteraceae bacterium]
MNNRDVGYLIKTINDKLKVRADEELKEHKLTLSQSRVLAFLNSCGGQATQKEIETFLEVSHPTVVGIVSRMEQNGHVTSEIDAKDKRKKIVRLTAQAEALTSEMEKKVVSNEKRILATLSKEDVEHLKKTLDIIYKNLE